jgi:adenylate cyclase
LTGARAERRLAAILAADVAGFSALMERDEEGTYARIGSLRREVIEPRLSEHQGRLIKTTGDGFLAEFASPIAALRCAHAVQEVLLTDPDALWLRIGINLGDVIVEESGDVYGEGVNIAARLEGLAEPGSVLISGKIHSEVEGKVEASFEDRGDQLVKNITRPVRVYAVRAPAASVASDKPSKTLDVSKPLPLPDKPSIAVLPFQNMSGDPEQDYFADGMVEDITTALSRIKWLFVIARNSSFTYKGKAIDIKQVGRELGVRYVLEGSVRKAAGRVRITGQLIDSATGTHLWADRFDGDLNDIFDLQDKITESVIGAISPKLLQSEFERSNRKPTSNLSAYDYYLRGLSKLHTSKREAFAEAKSLFQKAVELDPEYALAYATAAFWCCLLISFGWSEDRAREAKDAISAARKALELNKGDALVLAQAGYTLAYVADDLEESAEFLKQATVEDPNYALAWSVRGIVNVFLGNYEDAIAFIQRSVRLNPFDPWIFGAHNGLAYANLFLQRFDQAIDWAEKSVRQNPSYLGGRRALMACYAISGRVEDAKKVWEAARQMDPTQRISDIRARYPIRRNDDVAKLAEAFRLVGMPE